MAELKRIGALSTAKITGAIELVYGLVGAILLLLAGGIVAALLGPSLSAISGIGIILLVALPLAACAMSFVGNGLAALIYNAVASRIGGVIIDIRGRRLNGIGVVSLGKFAAIAGAVIGIVSGIAASALALGAPSGAAVASAVVVVAITVILTTVILAVVAMFYALVYNAMASLIGGVLLEISGGRLKGIGINSYTKMLTVFGLLEGILVGAIYASLSNNPSAAASLPTVALSFGTRSIIVFPLIYILIGIVCGASGAWLYDWFAKRIGGVVLVLK
jgi:hypothetical protein